MNKTGLNNNGRQCRRREEAARDLQSLVAFDVTAGSAVFFCTFSYAYYSSVYFSATEGNIFNAAPARLAVTAIPVNIVFVVGNMGF